MMRARVIGTCIATSSLSTSCCQKAFVLNSPTSAWQQALRRPWMPAARCSGWRLRSCETITTRSRALMTRDATSSASGFCCGKSHAAPVRMATQERIKCRSRGWSWRKIGVPPSRERCIRHSPTSPPHAGNACQTIALHSKPLSRSFQTTSPARSRMAPNTRPWLATS